MQTLTPALKAFIASHTAEEAEKLLLAAARYPGIDIPFAVEQLTARRQVRDKLPAWHANHDIIYPSRLAAEQCSSEATARYKQHLLRGTSCCDLTGGLGADAFYFAAAIPEVTYIERNPEYCEAARHNFAVLHADNIRVRQADVRDIAAQLHAGTCYIDPARRSEGNKRLFALEDCEPDILQLKTTLLQRCERLIVKISPMADIAETLRLLPETREIHIVETRNECKELLFAPRRSAPPCRHPLPRHAPGNLHLHPPRRTGSPVGNDGTGGQLPLRAPCSPLEKRRFQNPRPPLRAAQTAPPQPPLHLRHPPGGLPRAEIPHRSLPRIFRQTPETHQPGHPPSQPHHPQLPPQRGGTAPAEPHPRRRGHLPFRHHPCQRAKSHHPLPQSLSRGRHPPAPWDSPGISLLAASDLPAYDLLLTCMSPATDPLRQVSGKPPASHWQKGSGRTGRRTTPGRRGEHAARAWREAHVPNGFRPRAALRAGGRDGGRGDARAQKKQPAGFLFPPKKRTFAVSENVCLWKNAF